ncbi:MAG: hypothetical protein FD124_2371 [Alphaproteobacteria bacterium]|nr:MAG: hypothetical protein FD124_2371 [Alphaproteobacteria bacterium]
MKTSFLTPDTQRGGLRIIGLVLAVVSVILPAFPLGPIAAHPWTPMAALWAAYGWAAEADDMEKLQAWRGVRAPATLAVLGFLHDWIAGGPIGLYMILYLSAYLIGRVAASAMRSPQCDRRTCSRSGPGSSPHAWACAAWRRSSRPGRSAAMRA